MLASDPRAPRAQDQAHDDLSYQDHLSRQDLDARDRGARDAGCITPAIDAALLLLGQAAAREDRLLLPPPPALRARGSTLQKVLQALLKAGLVVEVPVSMEAQSRRSGDDGQRVGLVIAAEGFRAVGLPVPPPAPAAAPAAGQGAPPAAEPAGRTTKQAVLIALLSDEAGASVPALAETLAWQNHTVRAALTGLRQKGHVLARTKDAAGTTVYRITGQAGADAAGAATAAGA